MAISADITPVGRVPVVVVALRTDVLHGSSKGEKGNVVLSVGLGMPV